MTTREIQPAVDPCPKCGAAATPKWTGSFQCGSSEHCLGEAFVQSLGCKITCLERDLTHQLAATRAAERQRDSLQALAERAYPGLRKSGFCSRHRDDHHFECSTCYPDLNILIQENYQSWEQLYLQLLSLSGLTDPSGGRIGTNAIFEKIRSMLAARDSLAAKLREAERGLIEVLPTVLLAGCAPPIEDHHALLDIRDRLKCSQETAEYLFAQLHQTYPRLICFAAEHYRDLAKKLTTEPAAEAEGGRG